MKVNATSAIVEPRLPPFAGLPASSWTFAVRAWLAVILALFASFWLELEAPSSAAITVAILALPTRGQAMEKRKIDRGSHDARDLGDADRMPAGRHSEIPRP
jgi:hypothetical protein